MLLALIFFGLHWPFGLDQNADMILHKGDYVIGYDTTYRAPVWTVYRLTPEDLTGTAVRSNNFREDRVLPKRHRATLKDYRGSGYDRGHSVPAADFKRSREAMSSTFLLSNMLPQTSELNRVRWGILEAQIRDSVLTGDTAYVLTVVTMFGPDSAGTLIVPSLCLKAVVFIGNGDTTYAAWGYLNSKRPIGGHTGFDYVIGLTR